jgi:6-phosphofructokinase 1
MRSIAVLTSGGDSPGMNAALRSVAKVCAARGIQTIGVCDGYDGLIDRRFEPLGRGGRFDLDLLGGLGGTVLGTARCQRFFTAEGRQAAARSIVGLDGLIVIGGNGSLTGAHLLAREHGVKVVGLPASIDNDIGCSSTAIGVDTALNTIVDACDRISDTARSHRRAFVVEVMGRQSGYLAMASAVAAGADAVLFREQGRPEADLVEAVAGVVRKAFADQGKRRVLVIKAEGVEIPCTRLVRNVEEKVRDVLNGAELRAVVLGHTVRGGAPSHMDRMVAGRLAFGAVEALLAGGTDEMIGWGGSPGGIATGDPMVHRYPLERVLDETRKLLDGSSPVTRWRVEMMQKAEGVLPL